MNPGKTTLLVIHGWTAFSHPLLLIRIEVLAQQVGVFKQ